MNQLEIEEVSKNRKLLSIIESLLFVSGEPLKISHIANIIEQNISYTNELLEELKHNYEINESGIIIINNNGEYQLVTNPENGEYVQKLLKVNSKQSLSQASLETLSIIAYKQPITRVDIDEIRGVKSDRAIATLLEKSLIKESGRLDVPGRPILYGTTMEFLKHFGLESLEQMPSLKNFVDNAD